MAIETPSPDLAPSRYRLACVVLAGGQSQRYGGNKLLSLHPVSQQPLIVHSTNALLGALTTKHNTLNPLQKLCMFTPVVVTGKWHDSVSVALQSLPLDVTYNPQWQEGIGASIRCGIHRINQLACAEAVGPTHVLITLGDLALMQSDDYQRLITTSQHHPEHIVCSRWHNAVTGNSTAIKQDREHGNVKVPECIKAQVGAAVPAIFPIQDCDQLLELTGDVGAKPVITKAKANDRVCQVPMPHARYDIDTPEDWDQFRTAADGR